MIYQILCCIVFLFVLLFATVVDGFTLLGPYARSSVAMSFLLALGNMLVLLNLGFRHVDYVSRNETTIERMKNSRQENEDRHDDAGESSSLGSTHDLGWKRNFEEVFGPNRVSTFIWMFPYLAAAPTGDGMTY